MTELIFRKSPELHSDCAGRCVSQASSNVGCLRLQLLSHKSLTWSRTQTQRVSEVSSGDDTCHFWKVSSPHQNRHWRRAPHPTMPSPFTCGHTCSDCTYTCERKRDMDKHELTNRAHRFCNEICPRHGHLNNPTIRVLTPETLSARLEAPPNSLSASPSRSNTPSASSTSSRKRAREPSPEEDAEERLKRMKQEGRVLIETLKICCVLDPSRAARNYQEIESHSCWVEVELPGKEVNQLITSGELSGFVFRVPKYANNVRLYDWVSRISSQINVRPVYTEKCRRILRTPASERRGILSCSRPGRNCPSSSLMRAPIRRFGSSGTRGSIVSSGGLISQFGTLVFLG